MSSAGSLLDEYLDLSSPYRQLNIGYSFHGELIPNIWVYKSLSRMPNKVIYPLGQGKIQLFKYTLAARRDSLPGFFKQRITYGSSLHDCPGIKFQYG